MKRPSGKKPRLPNARKRKTGRKKARDTAAGPDELQGFFEDDAPRTEIGFKKPPKSYSWRKGESGNPSGRKKGSKNKRTIIIQLMEGRLGRKIPDLRKLSAQEAMLLKAIQKGLAGDAKAMAFAFKRYDDATGSSWSGQVITTEEDRQVYDHLRAKLRLEIEEEIDADE